MQLRSETSGKKRSRTPSPSPQAVAADVSRPFVLPSPEQQAADDAAYRAICRSLDEQRVQLAAMMSDTPDGQVATGGVALSPAAQQQPPPKPKRRLAKKGTQSCTPTAAVTLDSPAAIKACTIDANALPPSTSTATQSQPPKSTGHGAAATGKAGGRVTNKKAAEPAPPGACTIVVKLMTWPHT